MRFNAVFIGAFAIFSAYLVFSLPVAFATDVNIMFNGVVQETAKYEQERLVNMQISVKHEPSDITWTNIKLAVNVNSASLAHTIRKIFLYKCRSQTPTECVRTTPQEFDNYVDTELLWNDISERTGSAQYPQVANLLFLIKMEDENKRESWTGFFTQTRRTSYNIFDTQQLSIQTIDFYAKSLDFVEPAKNYIENKMMVPFRWATKVVFKGANQLYGIGANTQEIDAHSFQAAVVSSSEIGNINKDFYFVFPKISSGIANPVTLNLNPSFSCGNGFCESDIGETSSSCCYDCGCPSGQYCDVPSNINLSSCRADSASISVTSASTPLITDCSRGFDANISVRVNNPPTSLDSKISGTVKLNQTVYTVSCSGSSGSYDCSIPIASGIKCGGGSYVIGPGMLNLTLSYKDGPNTISKTLSTTFSGISVNYDCKCQEGSYCDTVKKTCQSESAITLGITKLTSYLDNYNPGDRIHLTAKIFNPPAGLVLVDKSATMNLTNGQVSPGTPECSPPNSQFEYNCTIPFQIANYQKTQAYTFNPNTLYFTITYNDGPIAKTKTISAPFGPVSIPSQYCGDNQCNMGENQESCCLDCGCPNPTIQYCDKVAGCVNKDSIGVSVSSVYPINFTDCRESHTVYLTLSIANAPSEMSLDYFAYLQNDVVKGWNLHCSKVSSNLLNCTLVIPPLEKEGCPLPYKIVGPNSINITISFPDGKSKQITKHLNAPFENIYVVPVYHCGDGVCESSLLESSSNCCYDCPCKNSPSFGEDYYCDFDPEDYLGTCLPKSNIKLVIDSPKAPVSFTSCEISNDVNIKAHIENQPKNTRPEFYYASLNNSNAEMVYCEPQKAYTGSNFSFNCTIRIPKIYKCSQGKTYTFSPNSFSMLISYENGRQKTETQTITANIPEITIHQGIRTLYDITQEGIAKMRSNLQRTMQIARDMMDAIRDCMEMVKLIGYLTLIASIAGGIYFGANTQTGSFGTGGLTITQQKVQSGIFAAFMISQIGTNLMQAYGKMCEYLSTMYQMDLKVQQIETEMIKMEMCMETNQHMLDTGKCENREESCFNAMVSCVNFKNIDSWTDQLTSIINKGNSYLSEMNTNLAKASTNFGVISGGIANGNFAIVCNGISKNNDVCCGCSGGADYRDGKPRNCKYTELEAIYPTNDQNCPEGYIIVIDDKSIMTNKKLIGNDITYFNDQQHIFSFYCDKDKNGRNTQPDIKVGDIKLTLLKCNAPDESSPCQCTGSAGSQAEEGCCYYEKDKICIMSVKKYCVGTFYDVKSCSEVDKCLSINTD